MCRLGGHGDPCTFTSGLTAGTAYTFTVTATNAAGVSLPSSPSASLTPATVPQAPTIVTATNVAGIGYARPRSHGLVDGRPTTAALPSPPTPSRRAPPVAYLHGRRAPPARSSGPHRRDGVHVHGDGHQRRRNQPVLVPHGEPHAGHRAPGADHRHGHQPDGHTYGIRPAVTVTWTDPANNGGSALTGYTVPRARPAEPAPAATGTATSCTITSGLTAGTAYTFTVTATNAAGTSRPTLGHLEHHPGHAPERPDRCDRLERGRHRQRRRPPGHRVVDRQLQRGLGHHRVHGDGQHRRRHLHDVRHDVHDPSGLTAGTGYTFTVTATNAAGTSTASTASAAVTEATVPAPRPSGRPPT